MNSRVVRGPLSTGVWPARPATCDEAERVDGVNSRT